MIYCFCLTFLITLALSPRMVHGMDAIIVMWINFLPVVCMLWNKATESKQTNLRLIFWYAATHYAIFHICLIWFGYWWEALKLPFWPASLFSFILVTLLVYYEMRDNGKRIQ